MSGVKDINNATIACFTSYNPVSRSTWKLAMDYDKVIVMTAQSFLNMLIQEAAKFEDIGLLVCTCHSMLYTVVHMAQILGFHRSQCRVCAPHSATSSNLCSSGV